MRLRQYPVQVGAREFGGQRVQDGLGELVELALAGQHGLQVGPVPPGRGGDRHGHRPPPRLERPPRARANHRRAEADRGHVALTDPPYAQRHPDLAGAETALAGVQHRTGVAQGGAFGRVLRGEACPQQQRARCRQLTRLVDVRGDDRGVPPQQRLEVVMATAEVPEQPVSQPGSLVFREAHDAGGDLARP